MVKKNYIKCSFKNKKKRIRINLHYIIVKRQKLICYSANKGTSI